MRQGFLLPNLISMVNSFANHILSSNVQEIVISTFNNKIDLHSDLEGVTSDLETRLTAAEENIQGERWYKDKT